MWEDGIFLGVMGKSGDLILGDVEDQDRPSQATQRTMGPEDDLLGTAPTMAYLRQ